MNREEFIFQRLKEHYNDIKDNYEVVGVFLQGSQNYGLDIYDEEYTSDIDSKAIILPSFEDIVYNRTPISTTFVRDNNEHIDLKDIRLMFENFKKQNSNFLEILFTKYKIINKKYSKLIQPLFDNKEAIARLDYNKGLNSQAGMSSQKLTALKHPYPTILPKIEKFGYDPKQLHHILRMNDFIKKFTSGKSFEDCLKPNNPDYLIKIKKGILSLEEAEKLAFETNEETYNISKLYQKLNNKIDDNALKILDDVKFNLLKQHFQEELAPQKEDFKPKNIFFTADNHFYHYNILAYQDRPFKSVEDMNTQMIKKWNELVTDKDLVYILGDFSFGSAKQTNEILNKLNGKKILIVGNHDDFLNNKDFDTSLFLEICGYKEITIYGKHLQLSHYPFASNDQKGYQLYGHIHDNRPNFIHHTNVELLPKNSYNVGVDVNNFKPINIKSIFKKIDNKLK